MLLTPLISLIFTLTLLFSDLVSNLDEVAEAEAEDSQPSKGKAPKKHLVSNNQVSSSF